MCNIGVDDEIDAFTYVIWGELQVAMCVKHQDCTDIFVCPFYTLNRVCRWLQCYVVTNERKQPAAYNTEG